MSLEERIDALTIAVQTLTLALADHRAVSSATHAVIEMNTAPVITNIEPEVPNEKSKPTTDISPASSNESRTVTYDDVKNATIAVSKIDKAKAVAGLARFGVQTAKALNEDQWLDYVVYMERVAKGEIDPESSHE